jgi:hypothetical protein
VVRQTPLAEKSTHNTKVLPDNSRIILPVVNWKTSQFLKIKADPSEEGGELSNFMVLSIVPDETTPRFQPPDELQKPVLLERVKLASAVTAATQG